MTRKDYIKLAAAFAKARAFADNANTEYAQWTVLQEVCKALEEDNEAFDRDRFIEAAYAKAAAIDSGPVWKRLSAGIYQIEGKGGDWFIERGEWGNGYPWAIGRRYGYGMMLPDAYFKTLAQAKAHLR